MIQRTLEIGISEGAAVVGISRSALYVAVRGGEVAGARKVGDRIWVARRAAFEAYRDQRRTKKAAR